MSHNKYLVSVKPISKIVDHLNGVLFHLGDVHGLALQFFIVSFVSFSRTALIPLRYGEIFLPRFLKRACHGDKRNTGTAVDEQEDRIVHVLATYLDPLLNSTNLYSLQAVDSIWRRDGALFRDPVLQIFPI